MTSVYIIFGIQATMRSKELSEALETYVYVF